MEDQTDKKEESSDFIEQNYHIVDWWDKLVPDVPLTAEILNSHHTVAWDPVEV